MVSAFTVHVLPAGKLWSLYAHLTPLPSQIITFMALFIDATSPLVPVTHAPTNHCQIAKQDSVAALNSNQRRFEKDWA